MYDEDDLLMISALQHLLFCERQCALIHVEQQWADNRLTVEGTLLHEQVDTPGSDSRKGVRLQRGMPLRSLQLGLIGKADLVEFHSLPAGVRPMPVEYKRGRAKPDLCDKVQVCAQALCLEEMMQTQVPEAAIFYGAPRRRLPVVIDDELRQATCAAAVRLHELIRSGLTPPATRMPKCNGCSLIDICMPDNGKARRFIDRIVTELAACKTQSDGSAAQEGESP